VLAPTGLVSITYAQFGHLHRLALLQSIAPYEPAFPAQLVHLCQLLHSSSQRTIHDKGPFFRKQLIADISLHNFLAVFQASEPLAQKFKPPYFYIE
jgi:hypothetical protein